MVDAPVSKHQCPQVSQKTQTHIPKKDKKMKVLFLAAAFVACALAEPPVENTYLPPGNSRYPESNFGFTQPQPSNSYGAPGNDIDGPANNHGAASSFEQGRNFEDSLTVDAAFGFNPSPDFTPPQNFGAKSRPNNFHSTPSNSYQAPNQYRPESKSAEPSSKYGAPARSAQPSSRYGAPSAPSSQYGAPARSQQPSQRYGAPARPSTNYGAPSTQSRSAAPSAQYGTPSRSAAPSTQYSAPKLSPQYSAPKPSSKYGAPSAPSSNYGPPSQYADEPSQRYGAPTPSQQYSAPSRSSAPRQFSASAPSRASQPSQKYGAPAQPSSQYGAPAQPSSQYGTPAQPSSQYGAPAQPSSQYGAPARDAQPSRQYNAQPKQAHNSYSANQDNRNQYQVPSAHSQDSYAAQSPANRYTDAFQTNSLSAPSNNVNYNSNSNQGYSNVPSQSRTRVSDQPSSEYGAPFQGYPEARTKKTTTEDPLAEAANYEYNYQVKDEDAPEGAEFGHQETREDEAARGEYRVLLPDGRMQIVEYEADEEGYRPKIRYEEVGYPGARSGQEQGPY